MKLASADTSNAIALECSHCSVFGGDRVPAVTSTAPYRAPLVARRATAAILLITGVVLAHLPAAVGIPCPVLTFTGVPCPFCGLTTSVRDTMGLRVSAAAHANPFGLAVVAAAVLVAALPSRAWKRLFPGAIRRALPTLGIAGLTASWFFELSRYHVI